MVFNKIIPPHSHEDYKFNRPYYKSLLIVYFRCYIDWGMQLMDFSMDKFYGFMDLFYVHYIIVIGGPKTVFRNKWPGVCVYYRPEFRIVGERMPRIPRVLYIPVLVRAAFDKCGTGTFQNRGLEIVAYYTPPLRWNIVVVSPDYKNGIKCRRCARDFW